MSGQQPGASRRRRIAGERRSARTVEAPPSESDLESESGSATTTRVDTPVETPQPEAPQPEAPQPDGAPPVAREDPAAEPTTPSRRWWGSISSLVGLGATLVALGVALAVLLLVAGLMAFGLLGNDSIAELQEADRVEQATRTAPATAERAAAAILVYDHKALEASKDAAVDFMTDDMAERYTETFDKVVAPAAEQTNATVTAEVLGSSVVRASEDRVRVLLFVDQSTTSTVNQQPKLALNRVEMVMVRDGDGWLVDEITSY